MKESSPKHNKHSPQWLYYYINWIKGNVVWSPFLLEYAISELFYLTDQECEYILTISTYAFSKPEKYNHSCFECKGMNFAD